MPGCVQAARLLLDNKLSAIFNFTYPVRKANAACGDVNVPNMFDETRPSVSMIPGLVTLVPPSKRELIAYQI